MADKSPAFHDGYEMKSEEIAAIGWIAARDAFNTSNPPGQPWTGSAEGLAFAQGEYQALCDRMPKLWPGHHRAAPSAQPQPSDCRPRQQPHDEAECWPDNHGPLSNLPHDA